MGINFNDNNMILVMDGVRIELDEDMVKEIKYAYEDWNNENSCSEDYIDEATIVKTIINIVKKYVNKHELGKTVGAEYVSQDDEAQKDAIHMFEEIMEFYTTLEGDF